VWRSQAGALSGARVALEVVVALAAATGLVAALELGLQIQNASSAYLLAVAAVAIRNGTVPAVITAFGAFLVYNLLFVEPRITFAVAHPAELITLFLLLFVGVVIGRLAGLQRDREQVAQRREREARAAFAISRELATAHRLTDAIATVLGRLVAETELRRAWVGLGPTIGQERIVADSASGDPVTPPGTYAQLRRDREEGAATWSRIHPTGGNPRSHDGARYRVELRSADEAIGSLWAERRAAGGELRLEETRLLAATADQIAQVVVRDRLAAAAADAEVARRGEELRSALLDSVSHDLRTPLASIRAAAGSIADPAIELGDEERRAAARSIDAEAERLNRLVGTLLDMSRIQAGALVPDLEVYPLPELVEPVLARMRVALDGHPLTVSLPPDLPSVRADATFLTQVVTNLIENASAHAPAGAPIAVRAAAADGRVTLVVEDGGPGVPRDALPRIFERFYRGGGSGPSRRGIGLGLAVVQGLVEAMGGAVRADRSPLGGLQVTVDLPAAGETP
jgi:two-component system, OmpR family, sensor histidine kinase KdpD